MAGHSQFKNIMHRKGGQDAKRARAFAKIGREITVAAKQGLPDPNHNPRLRSALVAARLANMTKDVVDRAIKKASGAGSELHRAGQRGAERPHHPLGRAQHLQGQGGGYQPA